MSAVVTSIHTLQRADFLRGREFLVLSAEVIASVLIYAAAIKLIYASIILTWLMYTCVR
jgi:hypothetical protein